MITLNDQELPWHDGLTVAELLQGIPDGHRYAVVRVGDRYVTRPNFDTYKIPDLSVIYLIPMVAGG